MLTFSSYAPCRHPGCWEECASPSVYCPRHRAEALARLRRLARPAPRSPAVIPFPAKALLGDRY